MRFAGQYHAAFMQLLTQSSQFACLHLQCSLETSIASCTVSPNSVEAMVKFMVKNAVQDESGCC